MTDKIYVVKDKDGRICFSLICADKQRAQALANNATAWSNPPDKHTIHEYIPAQEAEKLKQRIAELEAVIFKAQQIYRDDDAYKFGPDAETADAMYEALKEDK